MRNPKVSIIIPVYNGANYLKEAIESSINQSYPNIEIIVVNDGSTDAGQTEEIALSFKDKIRYFKKPNGGVATALNLGIAKAEGEYISWLSHDDLYLPQKIDQQIKHLGQHKNSERLILYSDFEGIDVVSHTSRVMKLPSINQGNGLYAALRLLFGSALHGCTLLIPKACFDEVGLFREDLRTTQDYELWFRFLKAGYTLDRVPQVLVQTRWHEEQGTHALSDIHCRELESLYIQAFDMFRDEFKAFSPAEVASLVMVLRSKDLKKSPEYILKNWPKDKTSYLALISMLNLNELKAGIRRKVSRFVRGAFPAKRHA